MAEETQSHLPLAVRSLAVRDEAGLAQEREVFVEAPAVKERGDPGPASALFFPIGTGVASTLGGFWALGQILRHGPPESALSIGAFIVAVLAFGLLWAPFTVGVWLARGWSRLLDRLVPRRAVASLALDDTRAVLAVPSDAGVGFEAQDVFELERDEVECFAHRDRVQLAEPGKTHIDAPRYWVVGKAELGALARDPRREATHELVARDGRLTLVRRNAWGRSHGD